ncbi:hypothetical protein [Stenotrophomonas sp.]|uniref:hypothetical protein n=1 Tax=Stenotrophomonas sp. TaxID=69392 RepID=UPI0028994467|nr:hypothetical protein [Stenotrophomonas sp.]
MPYNQLLLPLLGGYVLVAYANCFIYWSSRQSKEQLLLASAFAGALLALVSRVITLLVASTHWGQDIYRVVHAHVPYDGIGTAALSLALGALLVLWINRSWSIPEAGRWLYGRGSLTQLEALFLASFNGSVPMESAVFRPLPIELSMRMIAAVPVLGRPLRRRLFARKQWRVITHYDDVSRTASPAPIMVSMRDRKVYVGLLRHAPSFKASGMSHLNLEVLLGGYRDKDDLSVHFTDDYTAMFTSSPHAEWSFTAEEPRPVLPSFKVLPVCEIASASLFDAVVLERLQLQLGEIPDAVAESPGTPRLRQWIARILSGT